MSSELSRYVPKVAPFLLRTLLVFLIRQGNSLFHTKHTKAAPLFWFHAWGSQQPGKTASERDVDLPEELPSLLGTLPFRIDCSLLLLALLYCLSFKKILGC